MDTSSERRAAEERTVYLSFGRALPSEVAGNHRFELIVPFPVSRIAWGFRTLRRNFQKYVYLLYDIARRIHLSFTRADEIECWWDWKCREYSPRSPDQRLCIPVENVTRTSLITFIRIICISRSMRVEECRQICIDRSFRSLHRYTITLHRIALVAYISVSCKKRSTLIYLWKFRNLSRSAANIVL